MSERSGQAEYHGLALQRPVEGELTYTNTRFVEADMAQLRDAASWVSFSGCEFVDCDFTGSDLRGARLCGTVMQPGTASSFRGCRFDRADLRRAHLTGALFENCSFEDTNLYTVQFKRNNLIENRFAGVVKGLTIWGREPEAPRRARSGPNFIHGNDFRHADLQGLGLRGGVRVHDQLWPDSEDILIVDNLPYRAETAMKKLLREPDTTPISYPVASLRYFLRTGQTNYVMRRNDPDMPPEHNAVITALLEVPSLG